MRMSVLIAMSFAPAFARAADPPRRFELGVTAGAGGAVLDSSTVLSALWWNGIEQNVGLRGSSIPTGSEPRPAVVGLVLSLSITVPL